MSFDDEFVAEAIDVGASGYLTKDVSGARLVTAIRDVYNGGRVLDVSAMSKAHHTDDWLGDSDIDDDKEAGPQDVAAPVSPEPVEEKSPAISQRISLDLVIPPSSNSSMVLQLLDSLGQHLKVIILEVGGSPMTSTVVKILANNPSSLNDDLLRLEQVSKVTATSNEMMLASAGGAAEGTVTFTFYVELNDPNKKGPLHMSEWPNLAWANAAKKKSDQVAAEKDGSGRLSYAGCSTGLLASRPSVPPLEVHPITSVLLLGRHRSYPDPGPVTGHRYGASLRP